MNPPDYFVTFLKQLLNREEYILTESSYWRDLTNCVESIANPTLLRDIVENSKLPVDSVYYHYILARITHWELKDVLIWSSGIHV